MWRNCAEIAGALCVVVAAFLLELAAGFLVMGLLLIAVSNLGGSHADPE